MWQNKNNKLVQTFTFGDFDKALEFINQIGSIAKRDNHHPTITNSYTSVTIELSTHDANDTVTDKDFHFAKQVDSLLGVATMPTETKQNVIHLEKAKLYTDGGSRGNPGPSAGGYVILDMNDNVVKGNGKYLGITTNNQAEYHSLKGGVEMAISMGIIDLDIYMDSLLVINQMKGIYKIKNRDLWPIHDAISKLLPKFRKVTFTHVPRELNKLADAEVNKTLDAQN